MKFSMKPPVYRLTVQLKGDYILYTEYINVERTQHHTHIFIGYLFIFKID